ncbi:MAG: DUF192 domain-containing protein [Pseudomonadota bacterium]|nr:DUF192 domain-containing protein [Pseudomonadota bacterium]MDE3036920.1 DUF192 domain-containing protein [Pseudomonadota bacterium]
MNKLLIVIIILIFSTFSTFSAALALTFGHDTLAIKTASGERYFPVDVAETLPQQERGLMYRTRLADDYGMLFVMKADSDITMWMKNTPLSLDMLFIDKRGRIVYIAAQTTPESTAIVRAGRPVRAVLELKGGVAAKDGIRVGDRVMSRYFAP